MVTGEESVCPECGAAVPPPEYPSWSRTYCTNLCAMRHTGRQRRREFLVLDNATPAPPSECWLWDGRCDKNGYGHICYHGRARLAHQLSWEQANGRPVPRGLVVMHLCDVPTCVSPRHLRLGTQAENHADMIAKGRGGHAPEKLSPALVDAIAGMVGSSRGWISACARTYGVSHSLVSMIASGKRRINGRQAD